MELNSLVGPRIKVWEIILSLKIESFIAHMIAFVSDKCKNGKETYLLSRTKFYSAHD